MVAKKNIFDWNHISDKLSVDEVEELKSYYLGNVGLIKGLTKDTNCSNSLVIHSLYSPLQAELLALLQQEVLV